MSDLTPEEKRRIYEEEKARIEAEAKAKAAAQAEVKKKKTNKGCLIIILVFAVLYAIYYFLPKDKTYRPSSPARQYSSYTKPSPSSHFIIKVNKFSVGEYGYYEVVGEVTNTSSKPFHFVAVKAEYLNKAGIVVGQETTYVTGTDYLMPGETKSYKFMGENQPDYKSVRVVFDDATEVK